MAAMLQRLSRNCRTLRPVFRYLSEEIHIIKVVRYTHTFGLRYCSTAIPESQADDEQNMDDLTWGERLRVDDSLPQWMKTRKGQRKLYAKFGKASGINPAVAWPTRNELAEMIEDEREWRPTLAQMQSNINAQRRAQKIEQIKREKHIEACLAKMPKLEKQFYEDRQNKRLQQQAQQEKRAALLMEAKEKFGYAIDPRHPKFQKFMEEIEQQERKRRKELKKKGIII